METEKIPRLLARLAIPAVVAQIINLLYNIVDRIYIGHIPGVGAAALTGVGLFTPILMLINACAMLAGSGGAPRAAISMGKKDNKTAEKILGNCFVILLLMAVALTVLFFAFAPQLLTLFGASDQTLPYGVDYARIYILGSIFVLIVMGMNPFITTQGFAKISMMTTVIGAVINIILDPIFIFGLDMGTAGAALATGLSQFISFCILLFMCNSREECISIHPKKFKPTLAIYGEIIHGGLPSLGRQGIASIATIIMNTMAQPYGDAAIAAMSIVNRFMMFVGSAMIGFGQGYQPVCSYCFGARLYDRVKKACVYCVKVSTIFLLAVSVIGLIFSGNIIQMFRKDDLEVIRIGTLALRLQLLTMPLQGLVVMGGNMTPQSIGYGIRATIVSTARQGWLLIPILLCTVPVFGVLGIQMAQPIADVGTFILAAVVTKGIFKDLDRKKAETNL